MNFSEGISLLALKCNFIIAPNHHCNWFVMREVHSIKSSLRTQELQFDLHRQLERDIFNDHQRDRQSSLL